MPSDRITEKHLDDYLAKTQRALSKIKLAAPERSFNRKLADDFMAMATAYFKDARHFREAGDLVNAFACVNYAHGWLDCGARMGLFDVGGDDELFTLYE
ncbi:MAG: DUF357 domain-containing protein [Methanobacteriota archaeon]